MRKVFKLDEIDCAVCAGKLEAVSYTHLWKDLTLTAFATRPVCASSAIQHRYSPPGPPQKAWAVLSI